MSRTIVVTMVAIVLLVFALDLGGRANLVDPIPFPLTVTSGGAFFAAGIWLSLRLRPPRYYGAVRRVMAHVVVPVFALVIGTFLARTAVEAVAFVGLNPLSTPTEAVVVGLSSQKWGEHGATVSFGPATRDVDVEVTPQLYYRLDPYRVRGRDCLELTSETGRWGIRRTMLPRRFFDDAIGADQYVQCASEQPRP